jgi:hypothetical protein
LERISKQLLVSLSFSSIEGYGSEEFEIEINSPFKFLASSLSLGIKFFFGLQLKKFLM